MNSYGSPVSIASLLKLHHISDGVQKHLSKVYSTLALGTLVAAASCYGTITGMIPQIGSSMVSIIGLLCLMGITMTVPTSENKTTRFSLFLGFSFCQGVSLGPLIALVHALRPNAILSALIGTFLIFTCFSISALTTQRRSMLFLGGTLSSMLSILMFSSIINSVFFHSVDFFKTEIIISLFVFCGFVLYDTQLVIEKAELGSRDYIGHAAELLIDTVAIFVRLLIILSQNEDNKKKKRRED